MRDITHRRMGLLKKNIRAARRASGSEERAGRRRGQTAGSEFEGETVAGTSYRWYGKRRAPRRKGTPVYH